MHFGQWQPPLWVNGKPGNEDAGWREAPARIIVYARHWNQVSEVS